MKRTYTICDVCDEPINETKGMRTVKHRWFSWGLTRTEEEIEHVCSSCWSVMRSAALAATPADTEGGAAAEADRLLPPAEEE